MALSAVSAGVGWGIGKGLGYDPKVNGFDFGKSAVVGVGSSVLTQVMLRGKVSAEQVASDAFGHIVGESLTYGSGQQAQQPVPLTPGGERYQSIGMPAGNTYTPYNPEFDAEQARIAMMQRSADWYRTSGMPASSSSALLAGNSGVSSYQNVLTDFVVLPPRGDVDRNHSWQYYMSDPTTRSAFSLSPLNAQTQQFYSRSYWKAGE